MSVAELINKVTSETKIWSKVGTIEREHLTFVDSYYKSQMDEDRLIITHTKELEVVRACLKFGISGNGIELKVQ